MLMCLTLLPINPTYALEDEDMFKTKPEKVQHYETREYGAIYSKLKNMQKQLLLKHNFDNNEMMKVLEES